jgi:outer membrane protein assembly factor BamB
MDRISRIWRSLTAPERIVAAAAATVLVCTLVLAAVAFLKRPADINNPDAEFVRDEPQRVDRGPAERRQRLDWPRYGYDTQRTKFLDAQRIQPPFRKVWKYQQDQLIEFAPVIGGKRMYLIDNDGVFISLNADTGRVVWKKQLARLNASSPALVDGVLYAVSLQPGQAMAVRARDGKVLWRKDLPGRAESSPVVVRDRMYFGTEPGRFFALDTRNGKTIWERQLAGEVKAAPAFDDGTLYVGDYAGEMYAIRASDGQLRWQTGDLGSGAGRSGRFYSTPAVAFGRVYAGNVDGRVYSFVQGSGEIAWTFSAGHYVYSGIAAANTKGSRPAVYFGSHDRSVYAVNADNGKQIWKASPGGQVSGPATVIGSTVYVSTFTGNSTVGFDIRSGRRVFKIDDGEYGPAVSDGDRLYVQGGASVIAYDPVDVHGRYNPRPETRGIIPPSEYRRLLQRERERQQRRRQGQQGGGQQGQGQGNQQGGGQQGRG